ncbi:PepSY domain-containing protein [Pusillimonas sp. SM2304]|uniref:PepSY-associated TM helix domain-containing protein n=1 Tax=Pusillimonas sp. SM2304 TaxID=3073241 RepID=UPI002875F23A|nr:PepSY domain-containing protein [Pusillimonas sp. SM2304]MDS1139572.1 PepSY domain-containing protein [Pusillimonas sp. SM2304]
MTNGALRTWAWVHKWTSLVCTIFMLLLCLTGLPLIFHHEIGHLLGTETETAAMPADTPRADIDQVLDAARAVYPGKLVRYISQEPDDNTFWYVSLAATLDEQEKFDVAVVDARTAQVLGTPRFDEGFMAIMTRLHIDLFAGVPGMLFLGFMGLLLVIAIVSGVVLYAPFMRKLDFGTVRRDRSTQLKWLDLHNVLGVTTVAWAFAVGVTGVINTLSVPAVGYWQSSHVMPLIAQYQQGRTAPAPAPGQWASLQKAVVAAEATEPGMTLSFVAFPGALGATDHHYAIYMRGETPVTSRLYKPVLADGATGEVIVSIDPPWYLKTLYLSQPLHFGDYGGMPLKILWALLDLITIVVLGSGLYLWWSKARSARRRSALQAETVVHAGSV